MVLVALVGLAGMFLSRFVLLFGYRMVREGFRQSLIASLPRKVEVDEPFFGYATVQRFRQAGVEMSRGADVSNVAVWDWGPLANMPRRDPVTLRVALPPKDDSQARKPKCSALPCTDRRTGERFALNSIMMFTHLGTDLSWEVWIKDVFSKGGLRAMVDYLPHVLVDYFPHVLLD